MRTEKSKPRGGQNDEKSREPMWPVHTSGWAVIVDTKVKFPYTRRRKTGILMRSR